MKTHGINISATKNVIVPRIPTVFAVRESIKNQLEDSNTKIRVILTKKGIFFLTFIKLRPATIYNQND
jgi:hypothetical protein